MKDEIKEILELFAFADENIMFCDIVELNSKQSHLLLDYITNLQEENERLKKENTKLYKKDIKIINGLKEELETTEEKWNKDKQFSKCRTMEMLDYKQRNKKAIKCIKDKYYKEEYERKGTFANKLMNILQGEDKDE